MVMIADMGEQVIAITDRPIRVRVKMIHGEALPRVMLGGGLSWSPSQADRPLRGALNERRLTRDEMERMRREPGWYPEV